ncbi:MAG: class I SAM-dependent methyltransferase, partial [Candidatus Omnitrophica bacterium]|nr:class I SAM-dependent methyltransferase [Candidatus Omnitrophota bacterium]
GKIDLVFIDGNHSYEFVKSDTENALEMLSEKGVIIWHDYDYIIHKDVFRYLNKLAKTHKIYSIPHTRFAIYGRQLD